MPNVATVNEPTGTSAEIASVLREIQEGLAQTQTRLKELGMPALASVTLTLKTEVSSDKEGKIKVLIFTFGKTWKKETSQEIVLSMIPPPASPGGMAFVGPVLSERLAKAILGAAEGVQSAREGTPPLEVGSLSIDMGFIVEESKGGGGSLEISPVTVDLKGDLSHKAIHQMKVEFKRPR